MAHIPLPQLEEMSPPIQEKAKAILEKSGQLGEIFRLLAIDENIYNTTDVMVQNYLLKQTHLPYFTKEAIALLVSKENSCSMCVDVHKKIAKMLGLTQEQIDQILQGVEAIETDEATKALLRFCVRASRKDNYKITKEEIDALKALGWRDQEILEAVAITGYFNYINTLSNVFGLGNEA
ncbi:MAG: alkylhydroperoxidase [Nitratiruptor sp.]|nr:alkylhydroperoxidase [Nitratiruptor sp.]NPA84162.1 carboxymuconolactone decarboxylase family protein [Campylobacterota bacterium]